MDNIKKDISEDIRDLSISEVSGYVDSYIEPVRQALKDKYNGNDMVVEFIFHRYEIELKLMQIFIELEEDNKKRSTIINILLELYLRDLLSNHNDYDIESEIEYNYYYFWKEVIANIMAGYDIYNTMENYKTFHKVNHYVDNRIKFHNI